MIRIKPKSGKGPCLEIQTSGSAAPGDDYFKQIASFREKEGIQNEIIIEAEDYSGIRVDLDYLTPEMEDILWWLEASPPPEVANSFPLDVDEGGDVSIGDSSEMMFVEDTHLEKHAREACMKYWARSPVNNDFEQCRAYLSKKKGMPKAHEILFELCKEKVMLECGELARVSRSYTADRLMTYLSANHRNNHNRHVRDGVRKNMDADRHWYLQFGRYLIDCIGEYLNGLNHAAEGDKRFSTQEHLQHLRPFVLQKLPAWYSPDKYSFIFTGAKKNSGNEMNSLIIDDLDKVREEHPEFDGKATALMSEQIHKQALDSVKHVHEENKRLKKLLSKKDKSEDDAKAERDILKKQVAELQKEVKKLF